MKTNYENLMLIDLAMFDGNTNITADKGLSGEMKTYYNDFLIDLAEPLLVHYQFAQKKAIPKNDGKTVEFRKYSPLPKMTKALTEGVTPDGQKLNMTTISSTVEQYGGYIELSDMLLMTAIDNNMVQATELLGAQAGRTLDTITREVLVGGTNVYYADGKTARYQLTDESKLTVDLVRRVVRFLKQMNAPKINGYYIGIINPDTAYDLMNDPEWKYPHQYVDTKNIYSGEIGAIAGVRFVETTEGKIFHAPDLVLKKSDSMAHREITVKSVSGKQITIYEKLNAEQASELSGRHVIIRNKLYTIIYATAGAAGGASITLAETPSGDMAAEDIIYPGEAGAKGRDVYATLFLGGNAYGTTEISGGGLQHITKQLGSGGTSDPLEQRATVGWKATKVTKRLVEEYMIRCECCTTFNDVGVN